MVFGPAMRATAYESRHSAAGLSGAARDRYLPASSRSRAAAYKHRRAAASDELHMPTSLHSPKQRRCLR